jgi:hypothetical protein
VNRYVFVPFLTIVLTGCATTGTDLSSVIVGFLLFLFFAISLITFIRDGVQKLLRETEQTAEEVLEYYVSQLPDGVAGEIELYGRCHPGDKDYEFKQRMISIVEARWRRDEMKDLERYRSNI